VRWVIPEGVIHAPICKELNNKLQRSNQKTRRDLRENPKGKNYKERVPLSFEKAYNGGRLISSSMVSGINWSSLSRGGSLSIQVAIFR